MFKYDFYARYVEYDNDNYTYEHWFTRYFLTKEQAFEFFMEAKYELYCEELKVLTVEAVPYEKELVSVMF